MIIGKYKLTLPEYDELYLLPPDSVWIRKDCGEGGEFNKEDLFKKLEAVIDEFYKENF